MGYVSRAVGRRRLERSSPRVALFNYKEAWMAILVRYTPAGMTAEQYDNVGRKLEDGGDWPPQGLLAHVCFGSSGNLHVSEVWESRDLQEQFAQRLRPYLEEANVDLSGEPEYHDVQGYLFHEASSESGD